MVPIFRTEELSNLGGSLVRKDLDLCSSGVPIVGHRFCLKFLLFFTVVSFWFFPKKKNIKRLINLWKKKAKINK